MELGLNNVETVPNYIYVGGQNCAWYTVEDREQKPITVNALTGYLKNVEVKEREYKGNTSLKLILTIETDCTYKVQSGLDTWFSKTILIRLAQLTKDEAAQPITIIVNPGESENVVFAGLRTNNNINVQKPEDFNYHRFDDEDLYFKLIRTINLFLLPSEDSP